jgi:hypothetical protein
MYLQQRANSPLTATATTTVPLTSVTSVTSAHGLRFGALLIGIACAAFARAGDGMSTPGWSLSGFGSAGAGYSNNADSDYMTSSLKRNGVGASGRWSTSLDTRLGAQLNFKANEQWSAVLQVVSEQRFDGSYRPAVEWANIKYQATPDLAIRLGRIALPMFLAADYRKVGYAFPWVRPPVEVYGVIPITSSDGIDATYRSNRGALKNVTQGFFGRTRLALPDGAAAVAKRVAGFTNTTEYGAASVRLSMLSADLSMDLLRDFFNGFRQFGPQGDVLAERYAFDHKRVTAVSLGASYDPGRWFVMGELGRMRTRSLLGDTTGLYTTAGYRLGTFTPYLTFARVRANSPTTDPGLDLAGLPPPAAGAGAVMNGYLNALLTTVPIQRTVSIGTRWDCMTDIALKLQLDHVTPLDGSRGSFANVQPGFRSGRGVNIASAVLDLVF